MLINCKTCIFWVSGECHKKSPELVLKNTDEDCSSWPKTDAGDFCGQHQENQ